jgi:hypothetical protein
MNEKVSDPPFCGLSRLQQVIYPCPCQYELTGDCLVHTEVRNGLDGLGPCQRSPNRCRKRGNHANLVRTGTDAGLTGGYGNAFTGEM